MDGQAGPPPGCLAVPDRSPVLWDDAIRFNSFEKKIPMNYIVTTTFFALLSAAAAFSACSSEGQSTHNETVPKPESKLAAPGNFAFGIMKSYETCRDLLASDTSDGIVDCAKGIAKASATAHGAAPEAAQEYMRALERASEALAASPADDIEKARLAFGEVSKSVVAMLTVAPEAGAQYHVFECPMAKGYQRWAQPADELENPYMGSKMLTCGAEVHDHHRGEMHKETEPQKPAHGNHTH